MENSEQFFSCDEKSSGSSAEMRTGISSPPPPPHDEYDPDLTLEVADLPRERVAGDGSDHARPRAARILPVGAKPPLPTSSAAGCVPRNAVKSTPNLREPRPVVKKWSKSAADILNRCVVTHQRDLHEYFRANLDATLKPRDLCSDEEAVESPRGLYNHIKKCVEPFSLSNISVVESSPRQDLLLETTLVPVSPLQYSGSAATGPVNSTVIPPSTGHQPTSAQGLGRAPPVNSTMLPMHSTGISQLEIQESPHSGPIPRRMSPIGRSHSLLTEELMLNSGLSPVQCASSLSMDCWEVHPETSGEIPPPRRKSPVKVAAGGSKFRSSSGSFYIKQAYQEPDESLNPRCSSRHGTYRKRPDLLTEINSLNISDDDRRGQTVSVGMYSNQATAGSDVSEGNTNTHVYNSHIIGQAAQTRDSMAVHTSFTPTHTGYCNPNFEMTTGNVSSLLALSPTERTTLWLSNNQFLHLARKPKVRMAPPQVLGRKHGVGSVISAFGSTVNKHSLQMRQLVHKRAGKAPSMKAPSEVQKRSSDSEYSDCEALEDKPQGPEKTSLIQPTRGKLASCKKTQLQPPDIISNIPAGAKDLSAGQELSAVSANSTVHCHRIFPCLPRNKKRLAKLRKMKAAAKGAVYNKKPDSRQHVLCVV